MRIEDNQINDVFMEEGQKNSWFGSSSESIVNAMSCHISNVNDHSFSMGRILELNLFLQSKQQYLVIVLLYDIDVPPGLTLKDQV